MALKGLDIFKLTPKTNCKECGCPTCMAFGMKVAQGATTIDKCPHMSADAIATLSEATAPPMKTINFGEFTLGGETVMLRHEKTYVSKTLYAVSVCAPVYDNMIEDIKKVDYERIGERMYAESLNLVYVNDDKAGYVDMAKKAMEAGRAIILDCKDLDAARAALEVCASAKPILNGANPENYEAMSALATEFGVALGVIGTDLDSTHDIVEALEKAGNKNLVIDLGYVSAKEAFANAVQVRRAAIKDKDRTFGYPSLVNVGALAQGDEAMQTALASLFTMRYGSIVVMENLTYGQSLALHGLRQNMFTDPQKPMKVEPGIYPINGADENSICVTTVDFALTYFVVNSELERSGVPMNLLISDAGGYSVLTAWAAGKLSANSVAKFFKAADIEGKIKNRTLVLPGKVAVLKGEIEEALPGWKVVVGPNEAVGLVKFFKEYQD